MMFPLALLGCLLVFLPQPATSFTVKLLGTGNSYGERKTEVWENKWPIPGGGHDAFPDPNGNGTDEETLQELNDDESSLDSLRRRKYMSKAEVNSYLVNFGYMEPSPTGLISEEVRIEAIKSFQRFANLNPTGVLDLETVKMMNKPRCGVIDPATNENFANFDAKGSRKWDEKKLTYRIITYSEKLSKEAIDDAVAKAFQMWSDASQLVFVKVTSGSSDLKLRFSPKEHGDGEPFDGKGGVLAHAFFPKYGEIHMDAIENWTVKTRSGINLLFVLVHEIGHALGLGHSKVSGAIMGPFYGGYEPNLKLQPDDIAGIQYLYGKPLTQPPTTQPPTTKAPTTQPPTTKAPTTQPPTTKAPTTQPPTTKAPTTQAPTNEPPTTQASSTEVPTTKASDTTAPTTIAPTSTDSVTNVPTTENPPTTTEEIEPTEPMPPMQEFPCPFRFSAALTVNNRTYGFLRRFVVQILPNGRLGRRMYTRSIYRRSPRYITAAAYDENTGHTFLFSGRVVFRYTNHNLDRGFPKRMTYFIRNAAIVNGELIGMSFSRIHYLDQDMMIDYVDDEIGITDVYPGLDRYMRASISLGDGYAYMLYDWNVALVDMDTGTIVEKSCRSN